MKKIFIAILLMISMPCFCDPMLDSSKKEFNRLDSLCKEHLDSDKDLSVKLAIDMTKLAKEMENNEYLGNAYYRLGYVYSRIGDYGESIYNYLKSIDFRRKYADSLAIGETYCSLAYSFFKAKDYEKAEVYNLKCIEVLKNYPSNDFLKAAYLHLSRIYREKELYTKAFDYLQNTYNLAKNSHDTKQLALENTHLSSLCRKLNLYDSALKYDKASLELGIKIKDTVTIARALNNIGFTYHCMGKYEKAIYFFKSSLALKAMEEMANTYLSISDTYIIIGNYSEAEKTLDLALSNNPQNLRDVANTTESLARLLKNSNKLGLSVKYYELLASLKDSINQTQNTNYRIKYESKYAQSGEEKFYSEREKEFFNVVNKIQRDKLIIIAILCGVILIFTIILLGKYIRNYRTSKEIQSDLTMANKYFKEVLDRQKSGNAC